MTSWTPTCNPAHRSSPEPLARGRMAFGRTDSRHQALVVRPAHGRIPCRVRSSQQCQDLGRAALLQLYAR